MSYSKNTTAALLGFGSVQQFNQEMVELKIFNKKKQPQPTYIRQKFFTFRNGQTEKNGRTIYFPIIETTDRGIEFLKQTLKQKEGIKC